MEHRRWNEHGGAGWTRATRPLGPHTEAQTVGHRGPERGALGWTLCSPGPTWASRSAGICRRSPAPLTLPDTPLTIHARAPGLTHTCAATAPSPPGPSRADPQAPGPPALQSWATPARVHPSRPTGRPLLRLDLRPPCPARLGEGGWRIAPHISQSGYKSGYHPPPWRMLCGGPQGLRAPAGPQSLRRSLLSPARGRAAPCPAAQLGAGPAWPVQGREAAAGCVGGHRAPSSGQPGSHRGPAHSPLPAPAVGPDTLPASVRGYSRSW